MSAKKRFAAFHEAGHAVVRFSRLGVATALRANLDGSGFSDGTGDVCRKSDAIEISLAGPIAEAKLRRVSLVYVYMTSGLQDYESAVADAKQLAAIYVGVFPDPRAYVWRAAEENAKRILRQDWALVETLAGAAITRGNLTAVEVADILNLQ
jgi:hypothetical protein